MTAESRRIDTGRHFWATAIAGAVVAMLVGALYAHYIRSVAAWDRGATWEVRLLQAMHTSLPRALDLFLLFIPWLGTNITILPAVAIASWKLRRANRMDLVTTLLVAAAGNYFIGFAMKYAFGRPRPELWPGRGEYTGPSYPSGHAMMATSVLFTVAVMLRRERGWRWPYAASAIFGLITIYSRLYLGVHWPTDVVAGIVLGMIWLATMVRIIARPAPAQSPLIATSGSTRIAR